MTQSFRKIYLSLYLKGLCVRELETEQNCNILTPTVIAISVVSFLFSRAAQPEAWAPSSLLDAGFLYHILSPTGLVSKLTDFLSSLSYIIVQSPTQYLWNGMFDCHQAEITVVQFTGHSLPVHQSMYHGILPCPILSAKPAYVISSHNWPSEMCHFRCLWNGMFGRVEGQIYNTLLVVIKCQLCYAENEYIYDLL